MIEHSRPCLSGKDRWEVDSLLRSGMICKGERVAEFERAPGLVVMSDLQAVLGISQLRRYEDFLSRRRRIADEYCSRLRDDQTRLLSQWREKSIFFRFPVVLGHGSFDETARQFERRRIAVRRGVDCLLHREYGLSDQNFLNAVDRFDKTVSLPVYPGLNNKEIERIISAAGEILA